MAWQAERKHSGLRFTKVWHTRPGLFPGAPELRPIVKRPAVRSGRVRIAALSLLVGLGSLFGCSSPGFLPGTGRPMDAAVLGAMIDQASAVNRVPKSLIAAVIQAESHGDPSAISRAGAQGIMQLMPGTSIQYGVANPFDARENIEGGARYLRDLLRRYKGNVKLAVAAYNAGPGAVDAAHGIPPFAETRAYVSRVVAATATR
ncbi:MAG: hypothetical protein NVSMB64_13120 [Candidatus Velthaea sp.]